MSNPYTADSAALEAAHKARDDGAVRGRYVQAEINALGNE